MQIIQFVNCNITNLWQWNQLQLNRERSSKLFLSKCFQVGPVQYAYTFCTVQIVFNKNSHWFLFVREDEWAFDLLYCVAFLVMDKQWVEKNASYMDFNVRLILSTRKSSDCVFDRSYDWCNYQEILKSTRAQLEKELLLDDVTRIEDMPSYRLLC